MTDSSKIDRIVNKYSQKKHFKFALSFSLNGALVMLVSALLQHVYIDLLEEGLSPKYLFKDILLQAYLAGLLALIIGIVWMYFVHSYSANNAESN